MLTHIRDIPLIAFGLAFVRTRLAPLRERHERGASAVEWAIIAAVCVVAALAIAVAVNHVVAAGKQKIDQQLPAGP